MIERFRDGWTNATLGELIDSARPITYGVVQPGDYYPNGVILIRGGDYAAGWRSLEELYRVSPDIERPYSRARLKAGDLVITIKGEVGTVAQVPSELEGSNISQTNARLAINEERAAPRFILNYLQSSLGEIEIRKATQVGAQPGLVFGDIASFNVPLPPLSQQRRIVNVLDTWDYAIHRAERLVSVKQHRFQAIRIRLIERPQSASIDSNRWKSVEFLEIAEELKSRNAQLYSSDRVMGVIKGEGLVPMRSHVMAADLRRYLIVPPRAIAYNPMRLSIGSIAASSYDHDVLVSPDYVVFRASPGHADPDYLRFIIGTKRWRDHLTLVGSGSVRTRIYFDGLSEMVLRVPGLDEQQRIGRLLRTLEQDIEESSRALAALRIQKRGLMQKLLTGEWQLDERFDPKIVSS